jgi:hypothetical protein
MVDEAELLTAKIAKEIRKARREMTKKKRAALSDDPIKIHPTSN